MMRFHRLLAVVLIVGALLGLAAAIVDLYFAGPL